MTLTDREISTKRSMVYKANSPEILLPDFK